ncbi:LysR family substrate-binding domain-containing protein [Catalinimonas niigatensis]|uniref:LysR family substrate-binding domain-containing protein n=1 Tax=Catalinimonas niigatensis TaxID=1397264 RepID=UPI002667135A|nr:LysR family substrate-binding domain-containing protein [Catalinimonas niigatensis]WPP53646.1 LysR family substrate-binding domain-containing protein [Catalinimonas niigatensis]
MGYAGSLAYSFLPELLEKLASTFPELKLELVEPTDSSYEELLFNYTTDLIFSRDAPENTLLEYKCLYSENVSLVVPENHPLNEQNFNGLEDVKEDKFILSGLHHTTFYASLQQIFKEHGFEPNIYIESDFGAMILSLVARGLGISILPNAFHSGPFPGVRFLELPHKVKLYVIWWKGDSSPV